MKKTLFRSALAALALCTLSGLAHAETNAPSPAAPSASAGSNAPAPSPTPAPTQAPAAAAPKTVRTRLLADCEHGKCNDVVSVPPDEAKALKASGQADDTKAAVDYAASLPQNQPKPKTS